MDKNCHRDRVCNEFCRLPAPLEALKTRAWSCEKGILYMLHGVEQAAIWTWQKIAVIRELMDQVSAYVRDRLPRICSLELMRLMRQDTHEFEPWPAP